MPVSRHAPQPCRFETAVAKRLIHRFVPPPQFLRPARSKVDFVDDLIGASFKVNNPKAKASCGCGTSFSL
jgi:Fe-S cluster assembly iron-binding protein IscA